MKMRYLGCVMTLLVMPLQGASDCSSSLSSPSSSKSTASLSSSFSSSVSSSLSSSFVSVSSSMSSFLAYFQKKNQSQIQPTVELEVSEIIDEQDVFLDEAIDVKIKEKPIADASKKSELKSKPRYTSQQDLSSKNLEKLMKAYGYTKLKKTGKIAVQVEEKSSGFAFDDRKSWNKACSLLPKNLEILERKLDILHPIKGIGEKSGFLQPPSQLTTLKSVWREFKFALSSVLDIFMHSSFVSYLQWTNKGMPISDFFYNTKESIFQPYVQKLTLTPDDQVIFHGDIHGDIHSLLASLNKLEEMGFLRKGSFKLTNPRIYLVFLGNYVDKGYYGVEVIYTLLRLKLANPNNVILLRGQHEDFNFSSRADHSFGVEFAYKFGDSSEPYRMIERFYNLMPVALYLGCGTNYIQCCHGGVEHGYQPHDLLHSDAQFDLIGQLHRKRCLQSHNDRIANMVSQTKYNKKIWLDDSLNIDFTPATMQYPYPLGFVSFDFAKFGPSQWITHQGLAANEAFTQAVLDYQNKKSIVKVRGIFRAHQHDYSNGSSNSTNLMSELVASKGVYKLSRPIEIGQHRSMSDGIVWTFNVSPDNNYGQAHDYKFDAFAILKIATEYDDWRLQVFNAQAPERKNGAIVEFV